MSQLINARFLALTTRSLAEYKSLQESPVCIDFGNLALILKALQGTLIGSSKDLFKIPTNSFKDNKSSEFCTVSNAKSLRDSAPSSILSTIAVIALAALSIVVAETLINSVLIF